LKAISVRQPWAWLIIHGGKDIENRTWSSGVRGRVLIHAAKSMTHDEYDSAWLSSFGHIPTPLPGFNDLPRGGIVGSVEIVDCVQQSPSRWFVGDYGFVLRDPRPLSFRPMRGKLGFFEVPMEDIPNA
jgi:hypothetical protein